VRPGWFTNQVPGQPGLLHRKTLSRKNIRGEKNKTKTKKTKNKTTTTKTKTQTHEGNKYYVYSLPF
jgi:hypothetical protein